jgi:hypothetical protein
VFKGYSCSQDNSDLIVFIHWYKNNWSRKKKWYSKAKK